MPMYEYYCPTCDAAFELLVARADQADAQRCPTCHHTEITRQLSVFGVGAASPAGADGPPQCGFGACPNCR